MEAEGVVKIPQLAKFPVFFLSLWVSRVIFLYQFSTTNLFRFIHPFADGNGCTGRLWQSLILARWNPLFGDIPVESQIFEHQAEYYRDQVALFLGDKRSGTGSNPGSPAAPVRYRRDDPATAQRGAWAERR